MFSCLQKVCTANPLPTQGHAVQSLSIPERISPELIHLANLLDHYHNNRVGPSNLTQINRAWINVVALSWKLLGPKAFKGPAKPNAMWMDYFRCSDEESPYNIDVDGILEPPLDINFSRVMYNGGIYIPFIVGSVTRACVQRVGDGRCQQCKDRAVHTPFNGCWVIDGLFNSCCGNCCYNGHYDCEFSTKPGVKEVQRRQKLLQQANP